ncbi:sugar phosphate isomerase/epimerase [bacterium]|jgi:2-keto-myo-inositol isomerase|nr:sugar phosphate isomerase/epimerase [Verrucomicrobiota bacterium]MDA7632689.1 sugar phosphate isomerase/epimerase [bacterium]
MPAPHFSYSLNASTIRPTPLLQQIEIAAKAGYKGIELWHDAIDQSISDGGTLQDIQHCLLNNGLSVPTTIYLGDWFDTEESQLATVMDECKRRMEQAAFLGAPHVIAGPPSGIADQALGAQRYRKLLELGLALGTAPSMEFLGFVDQVNTIEEAIHILDLAEHPKGTTVLDPFHIFRGGGPVGSIQKLSPHQIAVCHFNDTPGSPERTHQHDHHRVMPGDGHLDLRAYLDQLRAIDYQGWLSLELFSEDYWKKDPLEVARIGMEKMRQVVEG